jgi:hypothetical protein
VVAGQRGDDDRGVSADEQVHARYPDAVNGAVDGPQGLRRGVPRDGVRAVQDAENLVDLEVLREPVDEFRVVARPRWLCMSHTDASAMTIESPAASPAETLSLPRLSAIVSRNDWAVRLSAGTCHRRVVYEPNCPA